jgi:hypothetical protein
MARNRITIEPGQTDVAQHDFGSKPPCSLEAVWPGVRNLNVMAGRAKIHLQAARAHWIVFNNKDTTPWCGIAVQASEGAARLRRLLCERQTDGELGAAAEPVAMRADLAAV